MTTQVSSDYFRDKAKADIAIKDKIDQSLSGKGKALIKAARLVREDRQPRKGVILHSDGRVTVRLRGLFCPGKSS